METTKNELPDFANSFFSKLRNYLDTKIYFFGSVQRYDYFPKSSDIDIAIFTDNINSTISKLQLFLNVSRSDFKKFVWKLNCDNSLVTGYKIMYKESNLDFAAEISIYDEKYKNSILSEHNGKSVLPIYATIMLIIIKYLFYTLGIIPSEWYIYLKKCILSTLIFKKPDEFVVLDLKNK